MSTTIMTRLFLFIERYILLFVKKVYKTLQQDKRRP